MSAFSKSVAINTIPHDPRRQTSVCECLIGKGKYFLKKKWGLFLKKCCSSTESCYMIYKFNKGGSMRAIDSPDFNQ